MLIRKKTSQVLEFLRIQPQQIGSARLLGIKVLLLDNHIEVAKKICAYITRRNNSFKAHMKSDSKTILSVWYKDLEPPLGNILNCTEDYAEEVVELFLKQREKESNIQLLSIKVMLPSGVDTDGISNYIVENYPEYKAHFKNQGKYPIVAIGYKE